MAARNDSKRCRYFDLVKILMTELERRGWGADMDLHCFEPGVDACDPRLDLLHEYPLLQRLLHYTMTCRSQAGLEESISNRGTVSVSGRIGCNYLLRTITDSIGEVPTRKKSPDMVSRILEAYQETIRWLLREDDYPGVLAEDLESFKAQFYNSTFTCRLRFCPRATIGFESEKLLKEHEWAHSAGPRCSFPRCQYPPFANSQALKRHVEKHHTPAQTVRPLRRVSKIRGSWEGSSIGWKGTGDASSRSLQNGQQPMTVSQFFNEPSYAQIMASQGQPATQTQWRPFDFQSYVVQARRQSDIPQQRYSVSPPPPPKYPREFKQTLPPVHPVHPVRINLFCMNQQALLWLIYFADGSP